MLASELILDSFYLGGILDPNEQVDGFYLETGMNILNDMLASWSSISNYVTFFNTLNFPIVANKYIYIVSKLPFSDVDAQPITNFIRGHVFLGGIKSDVRQSSTTLDNTDNYSIISGIPNSVYLLQKEAETELRFYPNPSSNMQASLLCKSRYGIIKPFESIVEIAERARLAVKYSLAQHIANYWQFQTTQDFKNAANDVVNDFMTSNIQDLPANGDRFATTNPTTYYPFGGVGGY